MEHGPGIQASIHDGLHFVDVNNLPWEGTLTAFNVPTGSFVFDMDQTRLSDGSSGWYSNEWAGLNNSDSSMYGRIGGEGYWSGVPTTSPAPSTNAVFGFVTTARGISTYWYHQEFSTGTPQTGNPYNFLISISEPGTFQGLFGQAGGGRLVLTFEWMRERADPPNGVMPGAVLGALLPAAGA